MPRKKPYDAGDEPPDNFRGKRRKRKSSKPPLEQSIRVAQREASGVATLEVAEVFMEVRDDVLSQLEAQVPEDKRGGQNMAKDVKMLDTCIIYWAKVFGRDGVDRLSIFMKLVRSVEGLWQPQDGPASQSARVAPNDPLPLRRAIEAYNIQTANRTSAMMGKCFRYIQASTFYREYQALIADAESPHGEMRQIFEAKGMTTSRGRDWKSLVNDYLVHCLDDLDPCDITSEAAKAARNRLKNEIQFCLPYHMLENTFGRGIFILLPEQDVNM